MEAATTSGAILRAAQRNTAHGFCFRGIVPGRYRLIFTYLGYRPDTIEITLRPADNSDLFLPMRMCRNVRSLKQVVVTARILPAIVRNDTIAFNAAAYPTRPNANIEDLLRQLPGIEIDKDGNITIQGRPVDKIYLDGKEFFLNDPSLATRNLPADIVDQIETFNSQTEKARLTGIRETTGTKSINIKLKKDRRKGSFGKAYAGTGTGAVSDPHSPAGAYSAGGTATSLGPSWVFGVGNLNNVNGQFTGEENGNGQGGGGIQTLKNLQCNYRINQSSANPLAVIFNAGTTGSRTLLNVVSSTQTALTDSSLLQNRTSQSLSTSQVTQGGLLVNYTIDSFSTINWSSALVATAGSSNETDTTAVSTLQSKTRWPDNRGQTVNGSHTHDLNLNNVLNYRLRGRLPGRTLFVSLTESYHEHRQPQSTYSLINNFDSLGNLLSRTLINQAIAQKAANDGYAGSVAYTEPLQPGHVLDVDYRFSRGISHSDRSSDDYDSATGRYDLPDTSTSNHFTTYNTIQRFGAAYNSTRGKFQYQLGLTLQFSVLENVNRSVDSTLTLRQTNWYPRASFTYSPGLGSSLVCTYNATTISPTLQQLQPVADPTDPFVIRIGNPRLLQALTHAVNLTYNNFSSNSLQNFQVSLQGNYTEHAISTSTTVLAGGIQQIQQR
jgi:Outer membrane protein beta-barrel family